MFFDYRCYETPAVTSNDLKQKDEWNHLEGQEMGLKAGPHNLSYLKKNGNMRWLMAVFQ